MSSSGGNRKSMDDVLSSIRRIIGTDKQEGRAVDDRDLSGTEEPAPLDLGAPIGKGAPSRDEPEEGTPMPLTSNMRVGFDHMDEDDATRVAHAHRATPGFPTADSAPADVQVPGPEADETTEIDEAALEDMIRRIVRDEIAQAVSEDTMKRIVHEELNGELGQRISVNVRRMIQDEVARLLRDPG